MSSHRDRDRHESRTERSRDHERRSRDSHRHRHEQDSSSHRRKRSPGSDRDRDRHCHDRHRHHHRTDESRSFKSSKRRETSQERRDRKAAKRARREKDLSGEEWQVDDQEDAAAQRTAAADLMMYSAGDNPFNDANLGEKFTWAKKEQKDKKLGLSRKDAEIKDAQRREEARAEIEKLNARRAERERETAIREEEEARMVRLAESAQMAEWVAKEDDFHLDQAKRRAAIRVRDNRAKPIDILSINLKWADPTRMEKVRDLGSDGQGLLELDDEDDEAGLEIDLEEPYNIFKNLDLEDTEELHQDIEMYLSFEKNESNLDFWRSMIIVCDAKLEELKDEDPSQVPTSRLDSTEKARINQMLSAKSSDELMDLQKQVRSKLSSGEPVDVEYWERVLKSIVVWNAKARLRDMHEVVLTNRIEYLQRKQRDEAFRVQKNLLSQLGGDLMDVSEEAANIAPTEGSSQLQKTASEAAQLEALYDADEMEPTPVEFSRLPYEDRHLSILTLAEDRQKLVEARRKVVGAVFVPKARGGQELSLSTGDTCEPEAAHFQKEANKALDVEEEVFNQDEDLTRQTYQWEDKYRPRKPRYFNRVHTGYEWNKYNQTHYDTDNPPPKVVQGYKFNIFYPDLIDKTVAPTYKIVKEPGNQDTVLLHFSAGPPYEDIAFRIVDKEWEYSHRRGFRSSFDRGILQLYFNFKRLHYRK